ncbi:MAG: DEAD/DEAH box helicase [Aestuariivita sp.]|nr:DEAD/DEAH box helicase [Aestuariivita sp.]MCY4203338.1 DEAD/DEAH box helicase [Aestuariivita sp.]
MAARKDSTETNAKPKKPNLVGWDTTDEDEVARRHWRGLTEISDVIALDGGDDTFGMYTVRSNSGREYRVEIRHLEERINSCTCNDFLTAQLGTCKHIEGALHFLRATEKHMRSVNRITASNRIEIYLPTDNLSPPIMSVPEDEESSPLHTDMKGRLDEFIQQPNDQSLRSLRQLADKHPTRVRVSLLLDAWKNRQLAEARAQTRRDEFAGDLESGKRTYDVLKFPLFPYQREGMTHLAFKERALLADDMGLGKTCQALAACELLRQISDVKRVLIVCPASLKSEWAEQIEAATGLDYRSIYGLRPARLAAYKDPAFFTITNYEQVRSDRQDLQELLNPDIVILDEAQRIKNWRTKTAIEIKQLRSRYAFVLTGTPIENRIDEIYSIFQFLDPMILGPLFRFNRRYYNLDDRGRAIGYRNLNELSDRVKQRMLRRSKTDVEDDLPERTNNNYFVPMTQEQQARYEDYESIVARLGATAKRRPLTEAEFKRLQLSLACMRMICDTPFILDPNVRDCPKLEELSRILEELLADEDSKVIIFSEWVRMLSLVQEMLEELDINYALHIGSVPQHKRKIEIDRFRKDSNCRIFLSSESGGAGLNLQVANAVINLDQPWNPAKLEQRIARAWRKHQMRTVTVANLVSENSIEHRMLSLIEQKKVVAEAVLDDDSNIDQLELPSGRASFLQRLEEIMGKDIPAEREPVSEVSVVEELQKTHGDHLFMVEERQTADGQSSLLAVIESVAEQVTNESSPAINGIPVQTIDRETYDKLLTLQAAGMVSFTSPNSTVLFQSDRPDQHEQRRQKRLVTARTLLDGADRKFRMATLLAGGGFTAEASSHASGIAQDAILALANVFADKIEQPEEGSTADLVENLSESENLPPELVSKALRLATMDLDAEVDIVASVADEEQDDALGSSAALLAFAKSAIAKAT